MNVPIGLQLWSVRDDCRKDFAGTLEEVKKIGYAGVEFAGYYDYSAGDLRKLIADLGLKCAGSHIGLPAFLGDELQKTIDYNLELGNKRLIIPGLPEENKGSAEAWKKSAELFCELNEKVIAAGLKMGYHNHAGEFEKIDGEVPQYLVFDNTPENFIMQLDIGWASCAEVDPLEVIGKYEGRSESVHVKEFDPNDETATVGKGTVDWQKVLPGVIEKGGCEWFVVEHERYSAPPLECVKDCFEFLNNLSI
ncbi:MAG: sugar phosphate isomerase/epimerase family protein [Planctomycetota bacterium]|jgi:sugar phosphate isomerase/epimerase